MTRGHGRATTAAMLVSAVVIVGASFAITGGYRGPVRPLRPAPPVATPWTTAPSDMEELVVNGTFETGDLTGWTVVNTGAPGKGNWFVTDAILSPLSNIAIRAPSEGTFQAVVDQTAEGTHILYQDIVIPEGASGNLKLVFWLENYFTSYADPVTLDHTVFPNQQARIDIMDPAAPVDDVGAGVLMNLFKTNVGDTTSVPPTMLDVPVDAFANTTVRLRFAEVENQFFFHVGVDAVSMLVTVPVPVSEASWGQIKSIYLR